MQLIVFTLRKTNSLNMNDTQGYRNICFKLIKSEVGTENRILVFRLKIEILFQFEVPSLLLRFAHSTNIQFVKLLNFSSFSAVPRPLSRERPLSLLSPIVECCAFCILNTI